MLEQKFFVSFRCFYPNDADPTNHRQELRLCDIPKWIDCYKFTHPACEAVTVKVWFSDLERISE